MRENRRNYGERKDKEELGENQKYNSIEALEKGENYNASSK